MRQCHNVSYKAFCDVGKYKVTRVVKSVDGRRMGTVKLLQMSME